MKQTAAVMRPMNSIFSPSLSLCSLGNKMNNRPSDLDLSLAVIHRPFAYTCTVLMVESSVSRSISRPPLLFITGRAVITDASR